MPSKACREALDLLLASQLAAFFHRPPHMKIFKRLTGGCWLVMFLMAGVPAIHALPVFQQTGNTLTMSNGNVMLKYNLAGGTTDFYWQNSKKISAFYSGVGLSTGYIVGTSYANWSYVLIGSNGVVITATGNNLPAMKQYFTLDQTNSFLVRVDLSATNLSANWMGPVVVSTTGGVDIGITNDNRALFVPFDNDAFVSYNAMPLNSSSTSYEVGAFYDNTSRNGLVVGSVTHDTWKSGVYFNGSNNKLNQMNVYGGASSPWDVMPHGYISGNVISSPTMFVGFGSDWRVVMESYAAENTNFAPKLTWTNGVPFGWNSWGVIQTGISYTDATAVSDFFHTNLEAMSFTNGSTVYINLDSYWSNLSPFQVQSFVNRCHAYGQKAGVYWSPFAYWGTAAQGSNSFITGSSTYYWSDTYLRTTNAGVQTVDGAIALDPTHPGTEQLVHYYVNLFTNYGFDFVKSDFMSHGAIEGVHYLTNVTTGIQAYNFGMSNILCQVNGSMFISESIAPLFPYQYGHSRRIACDSYTSLISNTEYTLNSVSYGWWLDDLYAFNDPDVMVFSGYGATTNENQSRLIGNAITGLFLDGDDLTTTNGRQAADMCLTNGAINAVARVGRSFTPVEGNTGTAASGTFVRQENNSTWSLAVFNYGSSAANQTVNLARAGLPAANYIAVNLWDGTISMASNTMTVNLNAKQAKLFQLTLRTPTNIVWNGTSSIWDTGTSVDWLIVSNNLRTAFMTGDDVTFNDVVGVPTTVTLVGTAIPGPVTVSPGLVTVASSVNNYTFGGAGTLAGAGGLVKSGSSTLVLDVAGTFTGPVSITGGTVQTAANTLGSVSSITVTNGGTLDFDGTTLAGNKPITVSGGGVNGGALYNSGGGLYGSQVLDITMTGNTTYGGSSRWDLAPGSTLSGAYKVTLDETNNGYAEWDTVTMATNVGDMELAVGSWGLKGLGAGMGDPSKTLTVDAGTALTVWNSSVGPNSGYEKNIHVLTNASLAVRTSPSTHFDANVVLEGGAQLDFYNGSGTGQTMTGSYLLNGLVTLQVGDSAILFSNVVSGTGGFVWNIYNNEVFFAASNTYSGPTVIGSGLTLGLTGNGSITHSGLIFFGGNNAANTSLDVSGRVDRTLTLAGGQTLGGVGGINGSLAVLIGATLAPGGTNTLTGINFGANSTGILAAANAVSLAGTTVIKLNGSGSSDEVQAGGAITYGGVLELTNISGSPLVAGNSFTIFNGAGYGGTFASLEPATPGTGLAWDVSQLTSVGVVKVVSAGGSGPVIGSTRVTNGSLIFGGTGGPASGQYAVLTATNLMTPVTDWTPLVTNSFDASGNFSVTNLINVHAPQQFYQIRIQ